MKILNVYSLSLICYIFFSTSAICQTIEGYVSNANHKNDTLIFKTGDIGKIYYDNEPPILPVKDGKFKLNVDFLYPQMYFLSWKSEQDIVSYYMGAYFFEKSTRSVVVDTSYAKTSIGNKTFAELKNRFIPFMLKGEKARSLDIFMYEKPDEFDKKLYAYISENHDSYVALWYTILKFNEKGYRDLYLKSLSLFSTTIKKSKPYLTLEKEVKSIRIKQGEIFPELNLKTTELTGIKLDIHGAQSKYILVDFWFARCRPCLAQVPKLIELYTAYHSKGLDIIGISTDKTENIELWKKRIIDNKIPWKNYLDENSRESNIEKIISFPTNFLLDENYKVIQKNISLEDLEKLLKEKL